LLEPFFLCPLVCLRGCGRWGGTMDRGLSCASCGGCGLPSSDAERGVRWRFYRLQYVGSFCQMGAFDLTVLVLKVRSRAMFWSSFSEGTRGYIEPARGRTRQQYVPLYRRQRNCLGTQECILLSWFHLPGQLAS